MEVTLKIYEGFAHDSITVSTAAVPLTVENVNPGSNAIRAEKVLISVADQPIRYTFDGTTPTASAGHPAVATDIIEIVGHNNISKFRAIRSGGSDATLHVTYQR